MSPKTLSYDFNGSRQFFCLSKSYEVEQFGSINMNVLEISPANGDEDADATTMKRREDCQDMYSSMNSLISENLTDD